MLPFPPRTGLVLLLVAIAACAGAPIHANETGLDDMTAEYFQGLRDRRLFRLAESYCLQRLSRGRLSRAVRVDLTLELARTLTEHAAYSTGSEQRDLWKQAKGAVGDLLKSEPDQPRRILLEVQRSLTPAAAGEWLRWVAELQPSDLSAAEQAAAELNDALAQLRTLDEKISTQVRKGTTVRTPEGELHPAEWRALGLRVRQRLGLVLIDLIHVLPHDSPERAAMLLEAQKVLRPLADVADDDDFAWMNRVALIECLRLSGDEARALKDLQTLDRRSPPRDIADRLLAERVRILQSQNKSAEATAALDEREKQRPPVSGELAFLRVWMTAEQSRGGGSRKEDPASEDLRKTLEQQVERLHREVGGYWSLRAELVVEQVRSDQLYGPELATLVRHAQAEFRRGKAKEAAEWYGKAASAAHRAGRSDLAFQFGFQRGSIEVEGRQWSEAAADLLELAEQFPENAKAAEAHLLAAYSLGRWHDENPTKSRRAEFARALEEHRERYADPATHGEATWLLACLQQRRGQTTAALKLYREIPREHARGKAAQAAVARCFETILGRLQELRQPTETWEREAITELTGVLPAASIRLDRDQCETAMGLSRILLHKRPPDYVAADRWLLRVLESQETPLPTEKMERTPTDGVNSASEPQRDPRAQALQLRIVSLAGQGRFQDAREQLDRVSTANPAELLQILEGLVPLAVSDQQDPFRDLGELQLQAALRLSEQRDTLAPADRRRLDVCLARGYAATGQSRRAMDLYASLVRETPSDKSLLAASAELLMKCGDQPCLQQALAAWRKIESLSAPGSDEWLAARYQVCRCLLAQGDTVEACKLLKVTRLLYPKLGGEKLMAKFAELENGCSGKAAK